MAVILVAMCVVGFLTLLLLYRSGMGSRPLVACLLAVAAAIFVRGLCLSYQSNDYNVFLSEWVAYFRDNGGFAALKYSIGDYNVPYLYFLAAISYLDVSDLYCIKLLSIVFDFVLAWGGWRVAKCVCANGSRRPVVVFCLLLLLPTVVLNGAYWGQCDVIYAAFCLHAVACALGKRPGLSVVLLTIAFAFKLQTVFLVPLWFGFLVTKRVGGRHLLLAVPAYLATCVPALLLGKPMRDIIGVYFGQASEYSGYLVLNAPSVHALVPADMSAYTDMFARLGIVAAFVMVFVLLGLFWIHRRRLTAEMLLMGGVILAIGVPFLLPYMHDRYFFLADVLALCLACVRARGILPAVLVQVASLRAYYNYFFIGGLSYPAWGVLLVLLALVLSWAAFLRGAAKPRRAT
ncbi:MAG: conjugal transfer protein TraL [Oscillospiraceae bacterium]|nr:conjugal transfer protein TraL [Oscillospiraceae bacterium]